MTALYRNAVSPGLEAVWDQAWTMGLQLSRCQYQQLDGQRYCIVQLTAPPSDLCNVLVEAAYVKKPINPFTTDLLYLPVIGLVNPGSIDEQAALQALADPDSDVGLHGIYTFELEPADRDVLDSTFELGPDELEGILELIPIEELLKYHADAVVAGRGDSLALHRDTDVSDPYNFPGDEALSPRGRQNHAAGQQGTGSQGAQQKQNHKQQATGTGGSTPRQKQRGRHQQHEQQQKQQGTGRQSARQMQQKQGAGTAPAAAGGRHSAPQMQQKQKQGPGTARPASAGPRGAQQKQEQVQQHKQQVPMQRKQKQGADTAHTAAAGPRGTQQKQEQVQQQKQQVPMQQQGAGTTHAAAAGSRGAQQKQEQVQQHKQQVPMQQQGAGTTHAAAAGPQGAQQTQEQVQQHKQRVPMQQQGAGITHAAAAGPQGAQQTQEQVQQQKQQVPMQQKQGAGITHAAAAGPQGAQQEEQERNHQEPVQQQQAGGQKSPADVGASQQEKQQQQEAAGGQKSPADVGASQQEKQQQQEAAGDSQPSAGTGDDKQQKKKEYAAALLGRLQQLFEDSHGIVEELSSSYSDKGQCVLDALSKSSSIHPRAIQGLTLADVVMLLLEVDAAGAASGLAVDDSCCAWLLQCAAAAGQPQEGAQMAAKLFAALWQQQRSSTMPFGSSSVIVSALVALACSPVVTPSAACMLMQCLDGQHDWCAVAACPDAAAAALKRLHALLQSRDELQRPVVVLGVAALSRMLPLADAARLLEAALPDEQIMSNEAHGTQVLRAVVGRLTRVVGFPSCDLRWAKQLCKPAYLSCAAVRNLCSTVLLLTDPSRMRSQLEMLLEEEEQLLQLERSSLVREVEQADMLVKQATKRLKLAEGHVAKHDEKMQLIRARKAKLLAEQTSEQMEEDTRE